MSARVPKTTMCLWYDRNAEDAAKFYARTFPGSSVGGRSCEQCSRAV
jgi:2-polyprenyl-6-hydroxyphenyl methylase/3-demethylubiquinone-9 3-methyltransferase